MRVRYSEKNKAANYLPLFRKTFDRCKYYAAFLMLFLAAPTMVMAQGVPTCGGDDDPFDACPLDTWVLVLVIAAVIFVTIHLYRKQKATA